MTPLQVYIEVQADAESHPVFGVILGLYDSTFTKEYNPFKNLLKCPTISTSTSKPCRCKVGASNREQIDAEVRALNKEASFQYDNPEFVQMIHRFLGLAHCCHHRELSRGRLEKLVESLKKDAKQPGNEMIPEIDDNEDYRSNKLLNPDPQDLSIADELSCLSISPGEESHISFSSASDADTVLTTPDATPLSQIDQILSCDPESRPETPCPPPRDSPDEAAQIDYLPSRTGSLDEPDEESDHGLDDQTLYPEAKTMDTSTFKRMTRTIGKLPLMHAIYHQWTKRDSERGRVYIWSHNQHPDIIKIGYSASAGGSAQRRAQPGNCYAINTTPVWESAEAFVGAYRVEQIVQGQFKENNVTTTEVACGSPKCAAKGTRHREWFRCDREVAERQILLWTELLARGFYEHSTNNSGPDGSDDVDGGYGMRISAKGNRILNELCNISPDILLKALEAGGPDVVSLGPREERHRDDGPTVSIRSSDDQPLSFADRVAAGITANHRGSESSQHSPNADAHEVHPLSDINSQKPPDTASTSEKGSPHQHQSTRARIKHFFSSKGKPRSWSDVQPKLRQLLSHMPRHADSSGGDSHHSKDEEDMLARLAVSVFFKEYVFESSESPQGGRKLVFGVSLGRERKSS